MKKGVLRSLRYSPFLKVLAQIWRWKYIEILFMENYTASETINGFYLFIQFGGLDTFMNPLVSF